MLGGIAMEIVEGTIGLIGSRGLLSGREQESPALEVGHRQLRHIRVSEQLSKAIEAGKFGRVLIWRGLSQGVVTRPFVAAIEVDGKIYKAERVLPMTLIKILLWLMVAVGIGSAAAAVLGVAVGAFVIGFYMKNYMDFLRFGPANEPATP